MRKSDLHPRLQATCVPVPGHSGCYAVVPEPVPAFVNVPACGGLFMLAHRELGVLGEAIRRNNDFAGLVFHMLNRREAVDSSQIEGTHTGFDGLLVHEIEVGFDGNDASSSDQDADQTLNYVSAFAYGSRQIVRLGKRALDLDLIRGLHAELLHGQGRYVPGQFRDRQNYIGSRMEIARYIPPPADHVRRLMEDIVGLLQYEVDGVASASVLMRAAIAHVQFEAIHPFLDGNGRVGRLLLPLMLAAEGVPPIHMATFLKVRQQEYYDALLAVQLHLNWQPWITLFLETVIASCRHTVQLFDHLRDINVRWHDVLATNRKRKHATVWRLADLLLGQPVVTVNVVADRLGVTFPAANSAVNELVQLDVLRPGTLRRRNRVFQAHEVMNALYSGLDSILADVERMRLV